jgi:serpin B
LRGRGGGDGPMRVPPDGDKLAPAFGALLKALQSPRTVGEKPAYELVVSNALWPQRGLPLKATFLDPVRKEFGATLEDVDYVKAPDAARKTINDAVAKQTRDRIKDLVPASAITPLTRLILTNAIYFKSNWMDKFYKEGTRSGPFTTADGNKVDGPMMHREGRCGYFENDDLQVLELRYSYADLSMIVLLPRTAEGLAALEKKLSAKQVAEWTAAAKESLVHVTLPRFKFAGRFGLAETLKAMGMPLAFSEDADFGGMTTAGEPLFISDVIHKSFVAVDEESTEAAAATAVILGKANGHGGGPEEKPKVFTADHPFVFLIRHNATGAILFAGRLAAPEGGEEAPKAGDADRSGPDRTPAPLPR